VAHIQKCPQCGGEVLDGYCYSCGIEVEDVSPEPQISYEGNQTAYGANQTAYREEQISYSEEQTVYPNVRVTDNINYSPPPAKENFFVKYARMSFGEKLAKYWWYILLSLFVPGLWLVPVVAAIGTALFSKTSGNGKFVGDQLLLAVIGLILLG
jgi:hypothetical protein